MMPTIPKWIIGWTVVIGLLPLFYTVVGYIDPISIFGDIAAIPNSKILSGPIGLWLARDLASVVITFYALYARSAHMIILACLLRIATDAMDFINNMVAGTLNAELLIFAPLLIIVSSIAIVKLHQLEKRNIGE